MTAVRLISKENGATGDRVRRNIFIHLYEYVRDGRRSTRVCSYDRRSCSLPNVNLWLAISEFVQVMYMKVMYNKRITH